ncbi:nitrogen fixation protein NifU [Legionella norrlandica]|uniref:Nitrogen fixation protein NifU n=1 Tax=Legionella norrlandica TaxID=1498499 RepID=A0A0A2SWX2_9GAMM|nr:iron-sulfur cluster assembly scaffold protein [Legionella norrlandica]KGP63884.1 nitrogen fixation protein NifU [Legionella norrlandica]
MIYNKKVKDCFFNPQHVEKLDLNNPLIVGIQSYTAHPRSEVNFYLRCEKDKLISRASFKTNGSPYVIAALEWLCRQIEGKSLETLPLLTYQVLINELEIPDSQYPIALQIEGIYKEALALVSKRFER